MKPTFNQFMKSENRKTVVLNANKFRGRKTIWRKITDPMFISRKRLVKLLMAGGYQRNDAQKFAERIRNHYGEYNLWYIEYMPNVLWNIQFRNGVYGRLYQAIFGEDMSHDMHEKMKAREAAEKEKRADDSAKKMKSEYEELCELMDKYPDIVDPRSCREVLHKTILERTVPSGVFDESGAERLDPKEGMREELNTMLCEISKIGNFLHYLYY